MMRMSDHRDMGIDEITRTLASAPAAFRALLSSAGADAIAFRESEGAWNACEVLAHVAHAELTDWRPRVAAIVSPEGDRRFTPFDREGGQSRYKDWTIAAIQEEFERLRADNVAYVKELRLDAAALRRTGIHPEFGEVTLDQLLACWVAHDLAHINQISRGLIRRLAPAVGPWTKYFSLLNGSRA